MKARILFAILLVSMLIAALPASAQLTVVANQSDYYLGEIVHLTIHNTGPHVAVFLSVPVFAVMRVSDGECVFGCVGLPVLTQMSVGETWHLDFDTSACSTPGPGLFGMYRVDLMGSSSDPGSVLSTTFRLYDALDVQPLAWGTLKGTYR